MKDFKPSCLFTLLLGLLVFAATAIIVAQSTDTRFDRLRVATNLDSVGNTNIGDNAADQWTATATLAGPLLLEGPVYDTFETTLSAAAQTADQTLYIPQSDAVSDTLALLGTAQTFTAAQTVNYLTIGTQWTATGTLIGPVTMEGPNFDGFDTLLSCSAQTVNQTIYIPDAAAATDTLAMLGRNQSFTGTTNSFTGDLSVLGGFQVGDASTDASTMSGTVTLYDNLLIGSEAADQWTATATLTGTLVMEGPNYDAFETVLSVSAQTADQTICLPQSDLAVDTIALLGTAQTRLAQLTFSVSGTDIASPSGEDLRIAADGNGTLVLDSTGGNVTIADGDAVNQIVTLGWANTFADTIRIGAGNAANAIQLGGTASTWTAGATLLGPMTWEGPNFDDFETVLSAAATTADRTIYLPDLDGCLSASVTGAGAGQAIQYITSQTADIDIVNTAANDTWSDTITITAAALGDQVQIAPMLDDAAWDNGVLSAFVESAGTVKIIFHADTDGANPAQMQYKVTVTHFP